MGCKGSKLDDQEPVALCRARAELLAAAMRHRYALADAHAALAGAIDSVAAPLHRLLRLAHDSPRLALPSERKGDAGGNRQPRVPPHGDSPSHLQFGSSSGSESVSPADSPSPPRPVPERQPPQPHYAYGYAPQPAFAYPAPAGSLQFYYARSRPPPASVAVAQRAPRPPERVYFGSFDAANGYQQYHAYGAEAQLAAAARQRASDPPERVYFGSFDAASGYPQYHAYGAEARPAAVVRQRASAPPSPPKASSWDFLNVFENYDSYGVDNYCYDSAAAAATAYTPSRSSREVREEEGIPDLEDDEEDTVVVKEVSGEYPGPGSGGARSQRSSVGGVSGVADFDEPESVIAHADVMGEAQRRPPAQRDVFVPTLAPATQRAPVSANADAAGEIKSQLVRTADAARELAPLLEVGRPSYQGRSSVFHSSSRMMSAISVSHLGCKEVDLLEVGLVGKVADSWSLSSALEKLYFWERKLYSEVKAEEKMRLLIAKNSKRLKLLDQRGAEPQKIDATRNLLRKLSTKIRIAVRVIAKISRKINKVRDEELWPQVNALIVGFVKMWQDKLDSYQTQCQVISEVKNLTSIESGRGSRDLAVELELELIKWIINFSSWVNAQRNFAKALNGWLALCLNYEPENACNGEPSYSPGRIGAPLIFVICNKWSQVMDRISEKDVVSAMQALASCVGHLWEQQHLEQSEQITAIREGEKWTKILERKTQDINKEAEELNKKLALVPSRHSLHMPRTVQTYEAHCVEASNLHINLSLVLQALESFAASSLQAFQEVLRCAEGSGLPRENVRRRKP